MSVLFGGLKQVVDCFQKVVGLVCLCLCDDVVEVFLDYVGDFFYGFNFGMYYVGILLFEYFGNDVDLFVIQDFV